MKTNMPDKSNPTDRQIPKTGIIPQNISLWLTQKQSFFN